MKIKGITVDFMGIARVTVIILCLFAAEGTPLFWVALYFLLKEVNYWIKRRVK